MTTGSIQLLQFIAGLAVLIFIHESGHFLAARFLKVEVEEFGFGFPPRLAKLFTSGGTEFTLNWLPLGGFVRLKGETDPDVPGGFGAANPWVRLGVVFAGPFTNIFLGIVLAVVMFYQAGEPIMDHILIQGLASGSPAEQAGLQVGDMLVEVEGQKIGSTDDLHNAIYDRLGQSTEITFLRQGEFMTVTLTPRNPPPPDEGAIGIIMGYETQPTTIASAVPRGIAYSFKVFESFLLLPVNLIRGNITAEEARPVGYKGMYDIYRQIEDPLWFFMMITMSLGIFNLFPIPALDGGRIILTLPEILIGKRIPPRYENAIHFVGFTVLLLLLIYINLQDFLNPAELPF